MFSPPPLLTEELKAETPSLVLADTIFPDFFPLLSFVTLWLLHVKKKKKSKGQPWIDKEAKRRDPSKQSSHCSD